MSEKPTKSQRPRQAGNRESNRLNQKDETAHLRAVRPGEEDSFTPGSLPAQLSLRLLRIVEKPQSEWRSYDWAAMCFRASIRLTVGGTVTREVLCFIGTWLDANGECFLVNEQIREEIECDERTVPKVLLRLERIGLLRREFRRIRVDVAGFKVTVRRRYLVVDPEVLLRIASAPGEREFRRLSSAGVVEMGDDDEEPAGEERAPPPCPSIGASPPCPHRRAPIVTYGITDSQAHGPEPISDVDEDCPRTEAQRVDDAPRPYTSPDLTLDELLQLARFERTWLEAKARTNGRSRPLPAARHHGGRPCPS